MRAPIGPTIEFPPLYPAFAKPGYWIGERPIGAYGFSSGMWIHGPVLALKTGFLPFLLGIAEAANYFRISADSLAQFLQNSFSLMRAYEEADYTTINQHDGKQHEVYRIFLAYQGW
ncbi:MAG: hypothetical protein AAFX93_16465 [Verrucomicrobiota bacterium]